MGPIQSTINTAVAGATKVAAAKMAADDTEAKKAQQAAQQAAQAQKEQQKDNMRALDAVEDYKVASNKSNGFSSMVSDAEKQGAGIQEKIDAQKQKLEQDGLSRQQRAGHKGAITRMQQALNRVNEQTEGYRYQKLLFEKRKETLRAIHGEAWNRMGVDPEGGKDGGNEQ